MDPVGYVLPDIRRAQEQAGAAGRELIFVASVLGTDADLQNVLPHLGDQGVHCLVHEGAAAERPPDIFLLWGHGIMMHMGIDALEADPETKYIALIARRIGDQVLPLVHEGAAAERPPDIFLLWGQLRYRLGGTGGDLLVRVHRPAIPREAADPETAVILLDFILTPPGHMDPVGYVLPDIRRAQEQAGQCRCFSR